MSVFTPVTPEQLRLWLKDYAVGTLLQLQGILAGIENTNYFVTTTQGRFVLTLFEKLKPSQLPFYLNLMSHLSNHGIACPKPIANGRNEVLGELNGKPATLVTCLPGVPKLAPSVEHCAQVGEALAGMHLAGKSYAGHLDNLRGPKWWSAVAPEIYPFLTDADAEALQAEIEYQAAQPTQALARGVVHADLFRDNVLFVEERIGGIIDFYFACVDAWIYDVAISVNDWCMGQGMTLDQARARALLRAYHGVRPLSDAERAAWPAMLRAAALRFWVSRLYDYHLPRPGALTHAHDPRQFQHILANHVKAGNAAFALLD